jgi:hypothetical protein
MQNESTRDGSNMKGVFKPQPYFASTIGSAGFDVYPIHWERIQSKQIGPLILPSGTSDLTHLWGDPSLPWAKSLPEIASVPNLRSIVTVYSSTMHGYQDKRCYAKTILKNLTPGKTYSVKCFVATTKRNSPWAQNGKKPAYAEEALIEIGNGNGSFVTFYDLKGKEAQWVEVTRAFVAESTEMELYFSGSTFNEDEEAFLNIYVDTNSIQQLISGN